MSNYRFTPLYFYLFINLKTAGALTLHYLDTLLQRPANEKQQFFSDLPAVLGDE